MASYLRDGVGFHHHKLILISGHIESIKDIPESKLKKIKLNEFDDDNMYFFKESLKHLPNEEDWGNTPVTFGIIDFFISLKIKDPAFKDESGRGTLVFDVPNGADSMPNEKMVVKNFTVQEKGTTRFGGTRACSPCTFLDKTNKMIHFKLGDDYYFPLVTFADRENPIGNCYFSFCKGQVGLLNALNEKADVNYILGIDDDPHIDIKAKVLVHEKLVI